MLGVAGVARCSLALWGLRGDEPADDEDRDMNDRVTTAMLVMSE